MYIGLNWPRIHDKAAGSITANNSLDRRIISNRSRTISTSQSGSEKSNAHRSCHCILINYVVLGVLRLTALLSSLCLCHKSPFDTQEFTKVFLNYTGKHCNFLKVSITLFNCQAMRYTIGNSWMITNFAKSSGTGCSCPKFSNCVH